MSRRGRVAVIAALFGVVVVLGLLVRHVSGVTRVDTAIVRWVAGWRGSTGADVAAFVTHFGQFHWPLTAVLLGGAVLAAAGAWTLAWRPLAALLLAVTIGPWFKGLVGRSRPPFEFWVNCPAGGDFPHCLPSSGFPSGHSGAAAAAWMGLAFVFAVRWPRHRIAFLVVGAALTVVVGLSRVVLGVHSPTDVLGGWCVGLACALIVAPWPPGGARRARAGRNAAPRG